MGCLVLQLKGALNSVEFFIFWFAALWKLWPMMAGFRWVRWCRGLVYFAAVLLPFGSAMLALARLTRHYSPIFEAFPGHTTGKKTEHRFWSHASQKDRFVIFGCGAAKMGKKSGRETIGTVGVKVQSLPWSKF